MTRDRPELEARAGHTMPPFLGLPGPVLSLPPFGTWALDSNNTIALAPVPFPLPGPRYMPVFVPDDPSLSGAQLRWQAIDIGPQGPAPIVRSTNWLQCQIQ
jgi:hypothetical protein